MKKENKMNKTKLMGLFMAAILFSTAILVVVPASACPAAKPGEVSSYNEISGTSIKPGGVSSYNEISGTSITGDDGVAVSWLIMPLLVLVLWCIQQCQCCEEYYQNDGDPNNEPTCCDNCWGPICE